MRPKPTVGCAGTAQHQNRCTAQMAKRTQPPTGRHRASVLETRPHHPLRSPYGRDTISESLVICQPNSTSSPKLWPQKVSVACRGRLPLRISSTTRADPRFRYQVLCADCDKYASSLQLALFRGGLSEQRAVQLTGPSRSER